MKKDYWASKNPDNTKVAVVHWRDIRTESAWDTDSDAEIRPARNLRTVGYLLHNGPDPDEPSSEIVVLAGTYDWEDKVWADFTVFPKVVLKGINNG